MYLLLLSLWIFVGLAAGWLVGKGLEGEGFGRSMDLVMGIGGGILGGVCMRSVGFSEVGGTALATLAAIACAALLAIATAMSEGRRVYTRAL